MKTPIQGKVCSIQHAADKLAIYVLLRDVRHALAAYDATNDHLAHPPDGDCIRCRLLKTMDPPSAGTKSPHETR
jgi:hypothetical protein